MQYEILVILMTMPVPNNILSLKEIRKRLAEKYGSSFQAYPQHFRGLIPTSAPSMQQSEVMHMLANLGKRKFTDFQIVGLNVWNLGELVLAGFRFAVGESFAHALERMNSLSTAAWWADTNSDNRPENLVMIAQSDPYILLLDLNDGGVFAFATYEGSYSAEFVARNVLELLRGLGTVELLSSRFSANTDMLTEFTQSLGDGTSQNFWLYQIEHWAQFD